MTSRLGTAYVRLEDVEPALRNPKKHDVEKLKVLFRRHGYLHQGIRDDRTGRSVAGMGRTEGLTQMWEAGEDRPEHIDLDVDGHWLVPIQVGWASRDDLHAEEVLSALNRAQDFAGVDAVIEWAILEDLVAHDPEALDRLGVTDEDMERLYREVNPDLADITGDPDGPDRADPGPAPGQDEDSPLDDEHEPKQSSTTCPSCGHVFFPSRV